MTTDAGAVGFAADEIDTAAPTRAARLKWVVAVRADLDPGRAVNAVACVAASAGAAVPGLLAAGPVDADGRAHAALPWAGCTVVEATPEQLATIRAKASAAADVFVADMPALAQATRVYDEVLEGLREVAEADAEYLAVAVVGPRNRVDRMTGRLPLLGAAASAAAAATSSDGA
jgi:peptidyl-tRNA hydrolase